MANYRDIRIECQYDFTGWNPSALNFNQPVFEAWYIDDYSNNATEFSDKLFSMNHNVSGTLRCFGDLVGGVRTFDSGNMSVVPTSGVVDIKIEARVSTITGTSGSYDADTDGYFKTYINNSLVYDSGAIKLWYGSSTIPSGGPYPYVNVFELGLHGRVGLYRVYVDNVLIHEEDWSSYGSDINAVSNNVGPDYGAYVYWDEIGSNLSGHGTTVSQTGGPNGGPGIIDLDSSAGFIAFNFIPTTPPPAEPEDPDTQTCPCVEGSIDQTGSPEPPEFLSPLIGTQLLCQVGGTVPDGPDPVWEETWWGV